jgi:hypothetical protein
MLRALTALACARAALSAGPLFCGTCANGGPPPMQNTVMTLSCADAGAVIVESSLWASYGTPSTPPTCAYAAGACAAPTSLAVVSAACAGQSLCKIYPNTTTFADPCFGTPKVLAVEAACSSGAGAAACEDASRDGELVLFSGNANPELAAEIGGLLGTPLGRATVSRFAVRR